MAKKKSKAPSGLSIGRSGNKYTFSWKKGATYKSQKLQYSLNGGGWQPGPGIAAGATSASITSTANNVAFRVCGTSKGKKASAWATSSRYFCYAPKAPSVTHESGEDSTTFKWENVTDSSDRPFTKMIWQSIILPNCSVKAGKDLPETEWANPEQGESTVASGDSAKWTKTETGWSEDSYSYTRWFRIKATGRAGESPWAYGKRTFAIPNKATNVLATRTKLTDGGFSIHASWTSPESEDRPIDKVTVRYRKSTPDITVTYPSSSSGTVTMSIACPDDSSDWQSLTDVSGLAGNRGLTFLDANDLADDKCLFLQVNNTYGSKTREGDVILVRTKDKPDDQDEAATLQVGKLTNPSTPTASAVSGSTHLYSVSVTRNTSVNAAAIAVYFKNSAEPGKEECIGIIDGAHGGTSASSSTQCYIPDVPEGATISFGARAFVGNYTPQTYPSGASAPTYFTLDEQNQFMSSDIVWGAGVPLAPTVTTAKINDSTVQVGWNWSWTDATNAELSWADHEDAWQSTDEPTTYIVSSQELGRWNIAGLSVGTWYIRVRLFKSIGDSVVYGAYSATQVVKLSASPDIPALLLSSGVITKDGTVTCYWAYVSGDGTGQQQGEVCEAFPTYEAVENPSESAVPIDQVWYELVDEHYVRSTDTVVDDEKTYYRATGEVTYGDPIASTATSQHIDINPSALGLNWNEGETHHLAVRVMSVSGERSEGWSAPVPVTIADKPTCTITSTTLENASITRGDVTETVLSLKALPLIVTATGTSNMTYIIERNGNYHLERPDSSDYMGFDQETIYINQNGGNSCTINQEDLLGMLDDGASYRLIAIAKDNYGQMAQSDPVEFEVHWTHQAVLPTATVVIDTTDHITKITPIQPSSGYVSGDVADIYRLSTDKPELIVKDAAFGTTYVDPYPAFGEFGGHRVVYRTLNGDYITAEGEMAWTDYTAEDDDAYKHDLFGIVIDFDDEQLILPYNVSINNTWSKDFTQTKYLGGSIQGDWNPAVEKSVSTNTVIPIEVEPDNVEMLRRLAVYPGICHVRMPDGSSFTANVDVRDNREEKWVSRLSKVSLEIKACDAEAFDGMTLSEWEDLQTIGT